MRQLITIILLLSFAAHTFNKSFIVVDYYTNTAAYAKNCENKARPKMHCNGRCQMMKKLKQEENKDRQNPERRSDKQEEVLSTRSCFAVVNFTPAAVLIKTNYPTYFSGNVVDMPQSIFHPPGARLFS